MSIAHGALLNSIFDEVTEEYKGKVKFAKLNVLASPENREIATHYGIMGTPTLVFFCNGISLGMVVGFIPKEHLKHMLNEMIEKHRECLNQRSVLKTYPSKDFSSVGLNRRIRRSS